jgi:hypothetical protein
LADSWRLPLWAKKYSDFECYGGIMRKILSFDKRVHITLKKMVQTQISTIFQSNSSLYGRNSDLL